MNVVAQAIAMRMLNAQTTMAVTAVLVIRDTQEMDFLAQVSSLYIIFHPGKLNIYHISMRAYSYPQYYI